MNARRRVDLALVERGLADSRARAQALVMAGLVFSGASFSMYLGVRRATADVPTIGTFDTSTFTSSTTSGKLAVNHYFIGFEIPFSRPWGHWRDLELTWILEEGIAIFRVDANDIYTGMGLDFATGLGLHLYTCLLYTSPSPRD